MSKPLLHRRILCEMARDTTLRELDIELRKLDVTRVSSIIVRGSREVHLTTTTNAFGWGMATSEADAFNLAIRRLREHIIDRANQAGNPK